MTTVFQSALASARSAGVLIAGLGLLAGDVIAGPVTVQEGVVDISYATPSGTDDARFNFNDAGTDTLQYAGEPLPGESLSTARGNIGVTYDFSELVDGALFNVNAFSNLFGAAGNATNGNLEFGVTFTTDSDLHYSLTVDPTSPGALFRTTFFDVDASLSVDAAGEFSGNLLENGQPAPRTFEGTIPAGVYIWTITANSIDPPGGVDGASTTGLATLTLSPDDIGPTPIPLPPAVATAAVTAVVFGVVERLRRGVQATP